MPNTTPTDPGSVTVPTLVDPTEHLNAQIVEAQANMDKLRPAVEAFDSWENMVKTLIAARDGRTATSGDRAARGERTAEFLDILREVGDEGISISKAANQMGMRTPNYLYRIVPPLVEQGLVRNADRRYFLAAEPVETPEAVTETE